MEFAFSQRHAGAAGDSPHQISAAGSPAADFGVCMDREAEMTREVQRIDEQKSVHRM